MAGPKMIADSNRSLFWVPTIANYHSPSLATDLAAASIKNISGLITIADFALGATGNAEIADPPYNASNDVKAPGMPTYDAAMNFYRWKNALEDVAWGIFTDKDIAGYLVERIGQVDDGLKNSEVPLQVGDEVRVFQVLTGTPQIQAPAQASYEKFRMQFFVQDEVDERAVIKA